MQQSHLLWMLFSLFVCLTEALVPLNETAAYDLCLSDPVCSKLFALTTAGSYPFFALQLALQGVPESPADLLADFTSLSANDQGNVLLLDRLVRIGTAAPQCPYDMVLEPDLLTGAGRCVCRPGVSCRPPCTDADAWTWTGMVLGMFFMVFLALSLLFRSADERSRSVGSSEKRDLASS